MNFDFTEEQESFRDQVRRLLTGMNALDRTRAALDGNTGSRELWTALAELGCVGVGIPGAYGGTELGILELCVVAEELGRAAASVPFLSSRGLATEAILRAGEDRAMRRWLPALSSGERVACYVDAPNSLELRDGQLWGDAAMVLDAPLSTLAVACARDAQGSPCLVLVELERDGVAVTVVGVVDAGHPHADLSFTGASATVLASGVAASAAMEHVRLHGALLAAFEQLGGAERCLEMARDYALQRRAFGRLIGSFQAIKHKLADVHVATTLARGHAYMGACALEHDNPDADLAISSARVACTEAFDRASQESIQVHGGIGFTWESNCHIYYRRARLLALTLGAPLIWKERVARALEARHPT